MFVQIDADSSPAAALFASFLATSFKKMSGIIQCERAVAIVIRSTTTQTCKIETGKSGFIIRVPKWWRQNNRSDVRDIEQTAEKVVKLAKARF